MTNDYSILSKYSAARLGYYEDPWLLEFIEKWLCIEKGWRRTPLVNLGYANRVMAVNFATCSLLYDPHEALDCFIVLGCGFDMRAAYHERVCNWIEIDLPEVIETKAKYFAHKWSLPIESVDRDVKTFEGKKLNLISCDIRYEADLAKKLYRVLARLPNVNNVAILNEVCLCYLQTQQVKQAISTIVDCVKDSAKSLCYLGFEQVRSTGNDPIAKIMNDHFKSLGYPLNHFPNREELQQLFIEQIGFDYVHIEPLHRMYHSQARFLQQKRSVEANLTKEPFDEFEEMDMYTSHYAIVEAKMTLKGQKAQWRPKFENENYDNEVVNLLDQIDRKTGRRPFEEPDEHVRRYGHSACVLRDTPETQIALISGGFGLSTPPSCPSSKQHRRLNECLLITRGRAGTQAANLLLDRFPLDRIRLDRMHGQICCIGAATSGLLLFSGGRQNPIKRGPDSNPTIVAKLTSDLKLELVHKFEENVSRWRHRMVKSSLDEIVQLGGLGGSATHDDSDGYLEMVVWNTSSDKLGCSSRVIRSVEPRHSFGLDMRDSHTLLIYGGLKSTSGRMRSCCVKRGDQYGNWYAAGDSDLEPVRQSVLYDMRQEAIARELKEQSISLYGAQVHFINANQFMRVGGISTTTGLPEQSIGLYDLRRSDGSLLLSAVPVTSQQDKLVLCNAPSLKFDGIKSIITFGGGGNYFTFGTHFNRSRLIYNYD